MAVVEFLGDRKKRTLEKERGGEKEGPTEGILGHQCSWPVTAWTSHPILTLLHLQSSWP